MAGTGAAGGTTTDVAGAGGSLGLWLKVSGPCRKHLFILIRKEQLQSHWHRLLNESHFAERQNQNAGRQSHFAERQNQVAERQSHFAERQNQNARRQSHFAKRLQVAGDLKLAFTRGKSRTAKDWKTAEMSSQAFPCGFLVLRCLSTIADAAEVIVKPRILANTPTPRRAGSLARTRDWGGLATTSAKHLENAESQKRPEDRTGISKLRTKNEEPRTSNQRLRRMSEGAPPNRPEEDDETALMPLRELEGAEKLATPGLMRSARPLGRGCDGAL